MRSASIVLLYLLSLGVAAYGLVGYAVLPMGTLVHPDMKAEFIAHPLAMFVHVFAAAVALLLGPFQFSTRLRRTRTQLHRWMGRAYLGIGVLAGGLSGLYIAQFAFGGAIAKLGFAMLAVGWLYTGWRALRAILRREFEAHRQWMLRNFSLAFAAVTLRLYLLAAVLAGVEFAVAYPIIAWLCWVPNLLFAQWRCNTTPAPSLPTAAGGSR